MKGERAIMTTESVLRLALIQMNSGSSDTSQNVEKAISYVDGAADRGADLIVLPEFFNVPYFAQEWDYGAMEFAEPEDGYTLTAIRKKAVDRQVHICATIYEEARAGIYFDTAFLIASDGTIRGRYRKTHPAAVKSLEKIFFKGGSLFPVWTVNGVRVSAIICYDHYFPETARCAALSGADVVVGPFAAPLETTELWTAMMITRAFENGVYMAPCNKVGIEGSWTFRGKSMIVGPLGNVLAEAGQDSEEIVLAEISADIVNAARRQFPMLRDRRPEIYGAISEFDDRLLERASVPPARVAEASVA
jgi:predicted amidohydrolase